MLRVERGKSEGSQSSHKVPGAERWQTRLLSSTHFFSKISRRFKSVFRIVSISVLLRDKRQRKTEASVPASHFQRRRKRDYEGVGPPTPPYRGSSAPPAKSRVGCPQILLLKQNMEPLTLTSYSQNFPVLARNQPRVLDISQFTSLCQ